MSTTNPDTLEIQQLETQLAKVKARAGLREKLEKFAKDNDQESVSSMLAFLGETTVQKPGRPAGSKAKKVKAKGDKKTDGRSKKSDELIAKIKAFMAKEPKPSKNATAKHFGIQPVTLNDWMGFKTKKRKK
ncbi:MAG: hypothetical protein ABIZ04_15575 [Opitutus sp.]